MCLLSTKQQRRANASIDLEEEETFLKLIDMYSVPIHLFYNGKSHYKTGVGGLLGIVAVVVAVGLGLVKMQADGHVQALVAAVWEV
jgi:hypothetical protein